MTKFSHTPTVCLDTNIVISLASFKRGSTDDIKFLKNTGSFSSIARLHELIKADKINAIITTTVLREILQGISFYGTNTSDYVRNSNIYVLELNSNKKNTFYTNVEKLAFQYCTPLKHNTMQQIARYNHTDLKAIAKSVFKFTKDKHSKRLSPINDARVLAQSVELGIPIVTNDYKDFITANRRDIISFINSKNKYPTGALPYSSEEFLRYMKDRSQFFSIDNYYANQVISAKDCELLR